MGIASHHHREDLDVYIGKADAALTSNLFRTTTEGPGAVTTAIFWRKTLASWNEKDRVEFNTNPSITLR